MNEQLAAQAHTAVKPTIAPVASRVLQRQCACGQHTLTGCGCEEYKKKREGTLQRAAINPWPMHEVPPIVHEVLRSSGQPLDAETLAFMQPRFGHDFSGVRVHTGAKATESARAVNALAYTVGQNVVFGEGHYAPRSIAGHTLLAHELTHVVQQERSRSSSRPLTVGPANDPSEVEARNWADRSMNSLGSSSLARPTPIDLSLRRACGPNEVAAQAGCIGRGGDIVDFGGDSGKLFRFNVNCDTFAPSEERRVQDLANSVTQDMELQIDGFASEEGPSDFNENLSCARAKVLSSKLMEFGVPSHQITDVYMHGATPGGREDRRSAVVTVTDLPSRVHEQPEDCSRLVGSCEFYRCRDRRHPCGEDGYYMGYGYKYCQRFTSLEPSLSAPARDWLRKTLLCLQVYVDRNIPYNADCTTVKAMAFDSHPDCYVGSGVCFLDVDDWTAIWNTIDLQDNDFKQVLVTGVYCAANLGVVGLMPLHSLAAGGGYRGLMERDRQRTRRLMRPFPPPVPQR